MLGWAGVAAPGMLGACILCGRGGGSSGLGARSYKGDPAFVSVGGGGWLFQGMEPVSYVAGAQGHGSGLGTNSF